MLNRTISYFIYGIIALGVLGLLNILFTNPLGLFKNIVMIAVIVGIVYFLYTQLIRNSKDQRAFRKAVRQSKKRNKGRLTQAKKNNVTNLTAAKSFHKIKTRKKSDVQLTVIEGKKNKKKNRASF